MSKTRDHKRRRQVEEAQRKRNERFGENVGRQLLDRFPDEFWTKLAEHNAKEKGER